MKSLSLVKLSMVVLVMSCGFSLKAQVKVGDNPNNINPSAVLEAESTNKGFLPPRVALTSTTSATPLSSHIQGMIVYNTATANDVVPALYVNDGTKWIKAVASTTTSNNNNSNIVTLDVGQTAVYYSGPIPASSWANLVQLSSLVPSNPPITFEGLKMDVTKSDASFWKPRIYNASNTASVTFSYDAIANVNYKATGTKRVLAAGTSNYEEIDGDALVYWTNNNQQETETMNVIVNDKWYRAVWVGYQIDNVHYIRMSLTRVN
ncbi:hypothetical protein [Flectobacillus roseus]|uniref:Uncharacterized protein n=1 Tax=Flectobacillus roseus TaxID=502259 RepID=A0ABT6Y624_9BACT|nr:hypothetical protein [Flectobacillus roseus]MDI9858987.1 hypothetical protein [Flectobacillus roseus]